MTVVRRKSPSDPEWVRFRKKVIAAAARNGCFFYIDADSFASRCPICEDSLYVRFIGPEPAADFVCHRGCSELDVARAFGRRR